MLIEEGILMSISIILAVWSMAKRGEKGGWMIFQGQSAVFWGIGFGFIYAGSISSLTALSEGSLLTTTAIGHAITAMVMMGILPMCLSWTGRPESEVGLDVEQSTPEELAGETKQMPMVGNLTHSQTNVEDEVVDYVFGITISSKPVSYTHLTLPTKRIV